MVGVCRYNGARARSVYADSNCDAYSNRAGSRGEYGYSDANGDCNTDPDSRFGGNSNEYTNGNTNRDCNTDAGSRCAG